MTERIRVFIAFEIPKNIKETIDRMAEGFRLQGTKLKWIPPDNIHLTLRFLGDIPISRVASVGRAMQLAAENCDPIKLGTKGMGLFPGPRHPKVLWVGGCGEIQRLCELEKRLGENLMNQGFHDEKKPFKAHLTIARVKGKIETESFSGSLAGVRDFESRLFFGRELILFRSELKSEGAVYTRLLNAPLNGGKIP